jgi:hypothetical protein
MTVALPKIAPLVLKPRADAFDNPDWLFELKYDGFRALLEIDAAGGHLLSRNRNLFLFRHLDPLAAALAKRLSVTDAILDGAAIGARCGRRTASSRLPVPGSQKCTILLLPCHRTRTEVLCGGQFSSANMSGLVYCLCSQHVELCS